jgi:hypothetical protein
MNAGVLVALGLASLLLLWATCRPGPQRPTREQQIRRTARRTERDLDQLFGQAAEEMLHRARRHRGRSPWQ